MQIHLESLSQVEYHDKVRNDDSIACIAIAMKVMGALEGVIMLCQHY